MFLAIGPPKSEEEKAYLIKLKSDMELTEKEYRDLGAKLQPIILEHFKGKNYAPRTKDKIMILAFGVCSAIEKEEYDLWTGRNTNGFYAW